MKKIISFFVVISFLLAVTAFLPINQSAAETNSSSSSSTSQTELEKIPSPEHLNFYEKIKKVGDALWGIRKVEPEKLEKISKPKDISFFEKVKKVGNALWGIRKKGLGRIITSETKDCVITAIEIKDKAMGDNNAYVAVELNKAIAARTACQKTALATTENQKKALDECARIFKDTHKLIKFNSNKANMAIAKTYRDSLKVCSKTVSGGTATSTAANTQEFNIEDGGGNIIDATGNDD